MKRALKRILPILIALAAAGTAHTADRGFETTTDA